MGVRVVLATIAALLLPGCLLTTSGNVRTITSDPPGALVRIAEFGECETPCTVKLDVVRELTIAKAGYKAQRFRVAPGGKDVHVILELAAPTSDVDAAELPELD